MRIVAMDEAHVPAVAALEKQCFSLPWSEQSVSGELSNPLSLWLVAEENGTLLGYVGSQTAAGESDMMNIAVVPEARRRGIARQLVLALLDALAGSGSTALTLEVRASNEPAVALYRSLGFLQVGRRPGYYMRPREDALIFRKEWKL